MEAKHNSDPKPSTGGHFLNFGALNGRFEGPPGYLGALPQALLDPGPARLEGGHSDDCLCRKLKMVIRSSLGLHRRVATPL